MCEMSSVRFVLWEIGLRAKRPRVIGPRGRFVKIDWSLGDWSLGDRSLGDRSLGDRSLGE